MIYTVTLNPALDKTVEIRDFKIGKVNRVENAKIQAGGKGINVSRIIKKLNKETTALSVIGGGNGKILLEKLNDEGIKTDFLVSSGETRVNTKIVDTKNNTYTDINESGFSVSDDIIEKLLSDLLAKITDNDIVVFAGSLPKGADVKTYSKWIKRFAQKGVKVFFDADKNALKSGIEAGPYFIKPNIDELSDLVGEKIDSVNKAKEHAKKLIGDTDLLVAVTLGENGSLLVSKNSAYFAKPLKVDVKSTVGAGDSFVAAVAVCTLANKSLVETLKFAAAVSSAKVMCEGVCAPDIDLIEELLEKIGVEEI